MRFYLHEVPGRIRVKSPLLKGSPERTESARRLLLSVDGVAAVEAKEITGSLVITHDGRRETRDAAIGLLQERGFFDPAKVETNEEYIQSAVTRAGQAAGKALLGTLVDRFLSGTPFALLSVLV